MFWAGHQGRWSQICRLRRCCRKLLSVLDASFFFPASVKLTSPTKCRSETLSLGVKATAGSSIHESTLRAIAWLAWRLYYTYLLILVGILLSCLMPCRVSA